MVHQPGKADLLTSTLHVTNIHCPSCVSYATDVLSGFSSAIRQIDTSIIDHTIRIQHERAISDQLVDELVKAAFEVVHVTVTDATGHVLRDADTQPASTRPSRRIWSTIFMSQAQKKHIENCDACQEERRGKHRRRTTWTDVLRNRRMSKASAGDDVERISSSPGSSRSRTTSAETKTPEHGDEELTYTALYSIEGMTCASCVSNITTRVRQEVYVKSIDVNLVANSATVVFHGPKSRANDIGEMIEEIGYGAELEEVQASNTDGASTAVYRASIALEGMTCGSCVGTITRGLQELQFVQDVNVDLVSNSASVFLHHKDDVEVVLETISDLGYDANLVSIEEVGTSAHSTTPTERSVQVLIQGMYCPKCPPNVIAAIQDTFGEQVRVSQKPTLKEPHITVNYYPSAPNLTIRHIIAAIDNVDPACTASVYHPPSMEERSRSIQVKERNRVLRHLLVTSLAVIPSFIVGVVYMSLVPASNHTRQWFEEAIWSGNAARMDWALFLMATPVMFYGANLFHKRALKEIWTLWKPSSRTPILRRFYRFGSMNLLISAGTAVAYFASLAVLIMDATSPRQPANMNRQSSTYFDTVTFLTFFILIGRFLEAYSKAKTGDAVSMLANLRPKTASLAEETLKQDGKPSQTVLKQIPVDLLEAGDVVNIPHGACPPTDGTIAHEGNFLFDESSLTGESRPATKVFDDKLFAGTINIGDPVKMKVTEIGGKSLLDEIVSVVREGQAKRARIERLADTLTGYFTPVITLLAVSTWIIWLVLGETGVLPQGWLDVARGGWPYWSVEFAIAVFVVACPCGIGLAAPTALFVGGGLAAKAGILVQGGGEAFQEASNVDTIVFDKTGTLTEGQMKVAESVLLEKEKMKEDVMYTIIQALEESSTHPIAKAIVQHCTKSKSTDLSVGIRTLQMKEIPGQGMTGRFEIEFNSEQMVYDAAIGNERLLESLKNEPVDDYADEKRVHTVKMSASNVFLSSTLSRFQSEGNSTATFVSRVVKSSSTESETFSPVAAFAISDPVRENAPEILAALRSQGVEVHMCTGDNRQTAQSIAHQLSISPANIRAEVLPQDKATYVKELQNLQSTRKVVAFVGDGSNDTPALTVADVSIALSHPQGGGSDIALTSSSFVLLNSDLASVLTLFKLSRRVFFRVKLNFLWAAIYNICLIPVAAGVFFPLGATWGDNAHGGFRLSPVWASIAMAGSSVSVVLSSLALRLPELELASFLGQVRGKTRD